MAEDDEVDVLGDYNLDLLSKPGCFEDTPLVSQNSDLLNCDYTIHPQWLLDKPSANPALWYSTNTEEISKHLELENHHESNATTENCITDESGWTEKEKDLLNRGIEIFGKSSINLSQFIGSRTPAEVKYFLKNFYTDTHLTYVPVTENIFDGNFTEETIISTDESVQVLHDQDIPASMEEVVSSKLSKTNEKGSNLKKSDGSQYKIASFKSGGNNYHQFDNNYTKTSAKKGVKFKTKINIMSPLIGNNKFSAKKSKKVVKKSKEPPSSPLKSSVQSDVIHIVTGNGIGVPVCKGEQVVKIIKESESANSDSDIEIDIEDENDVLKAPSRPVNEKSIVDSPSKEKKPKLLENETEVDNIVAKKRPQLDDLSEEAVQILVSQEYPKADLKIIESEVSEVEKFLFFDFFEGKSIKTPERYLHIRNYILRMWRTSKPNYLRKISVRHGLKQAGDVNIIGRIHNYLEQVGAINFGCEITKYKRPLKDLAMSSITSAVNKEKIQPLKCDSLPRQRIKKKFNNDGEGGCTLTHDEKGEVINTTVVNEEPVTKSKQYFKKPAIQLIYCRPFNAEFKQKYKIHLDISALLLMDLHAHMYLTEVMGLIGGYYNPPNNELIIKRYIPCKNSAESSTHCDMCPISQAAASEQIHSENLDILGWFHSHPTFAPEPSQQDMDTQLSVQRWIGSQTPCLGFILAPFSLHGALIASPYRCLMVHKKEDGKLVPYKFQVSLLNAHLNVERFLGNASSMICNEDGNNSKQKVDFFKIYYHDNSITYLDKYIYSVKMHLAKCPNINKMTCDEIIEGLTNICSRRH